MTLYTAGPAPATRLDMTEPESLALAELVARAVGRLAITVLAHRLFLGLESVCVPHLAPGFYHSLTLRVAGYDDKTVVGRLLALLAQDSLGDGYGLSLESGARSENQDHVRYDKNNDKETRVIAKKPKAFAGPVPQGRCR